MRKIAGHGQLGMGPVYDVSEVDHQPASQMDTWTGNGIRRRLPATSCAESRTSCGSCWCRRWRYRRARRVPIADRRQPSSCVGACWPRAATESRHVTTTTTSRQAWHRHRRRHHRRLTVASTGCRSVGHGSHRRVRIPVRTTETVAVSNKSIISPLIIQTNTTITDVVYRAGRSLRNETGLQKLLLTGGGLA